MNTRCRWWLVAAAIALLPAAGVVRAQDNHTYCGMADKATHGFVNIFSGWLELPMQTYKGYENGVKAFKVEESAANRTMGTLGGFVRGLFHGVGRTVYGGTELLGFWLANPSDNKGIWPLLDSEYAWEMGEQKLGFTADSGVMFKGMGTRAVRGGKNILPGVAEVPGQIYKGCLERRYLVGIPKGLWFGFSRVYNGAVDILLFPFPGPEAQLGVPYEEIEAWDTFNKRFYNNVK